MYKYNCWLSVSTQRSPVTDCAAPGAVVAFFNPDALIQVVPSYNFNWSTPAVLSYHNCPSVGLLGAELFAKFSNRCKKFSAIAVP